MNELKREVGLRVASVKLAVERLAVKVRKVDNIGIDDGQPADTRPRECGNDRAADAACTDYGNGRFLEAALAEPADLRQDDVPRIALQLGVGEAHRPVEPKPP